MPRRRANGEGTIYRRKDGRYEGAAYFLTTTGKRKRLRVYGQTRDEVSAKLAEAKVRAYQGVPLPDRTWKLGEYLDYWLERAKRRPLTYRRHESISRLYLRPGLGQYRLNRLSVHVVQNFLDRLLADGKPPATIYQVRKVLSAALTYAMRQELIFRNVARLVELPQYSPREARHWTREETVRFLEVARPDPLYPVFALLALYGLRRGEVLGIRWSDVDFGKGVLRIRQQIQRINGSLQQVELKTDTSRRDAPLLPTARDLLLKQKQEQAAARVAAGSSWQGTGTETELIFTTKTGRPIESRNLYRSFLRICRQHRLRRITIHGLRHSNATTQKELQVHDRDIQAILGHGDVRTTGIYEHVDMDSKRRALERVEQGLFDLTAATDRLRCRQLQPSSQELQVEYDGIVSGGSSQTRTGDTRLFRPSLAILRERLQSVDLVMQSRTRHWLLGAVAVNLSRQDHSEEPSCSAE